jgi:hypothetical protein
MNSTLEIGDNVSNQELYRVALTIAFALSNPREFGLSSPQDYRLILVIDKTSWDAARMADRVKNTRPHTDGGVLAEDLRLAKFFRNPLFGHFDEPSTVLDMHGRIMVWYLPFIFHPGRIVRLFIPNTSKYEA